MLKLCTILLNILILNVLKINFGLKELKRIALLVYVKQNAWCVALMYLILCHALLTL